MDRRERERLQYAYEEGKCGGDTPEAILAKWQRPACPMCHERQHGWAAVPFCFAFFVGDVIFFVGVQSMK